MIGTRAASAREGRLVGVDAARYLALVGMISTHLLEADEDGRLTGIQWLATGRSSALFAFLAGVSIALATRPGRAGAATSVRSRSAGLVVRGLLVAALGLALGQLDTGLAVILTYYGVLFVLAVPFVGLRARTLWTLAAVWVVAAPVVSQLLRPHLPRRGFATPDVSQLAEPLQLLSELTFTGYYPAVPWLAYLFAGMALARLDLRSTSVLTLVTGGGLLLSVGATVVSETLLRRPAVIDPLLASLGAANVQDLRMVIDQGMYGSTPEDGPWQWLLVVAPHSTTPFDLAQTIGSSLAVTGACLLVLHLLPAVASRVVAVVMGAGAMTLTLYCLHAVMRTPQVWPSEEPGSFWIHVAIVTAIGAVFALLGRRGPLETLVSTCSRAAALAVSPRRSEADRPTT